jgi:hypothetical protein
MPLTRRIFQNDVKPEYALALKERLVSFRARHLQETLPDIPKPALNRLGDILRPIQKIIRLVKPEIEESFLKFVEKIRQEKQLEKLDSVEAKVYLAVIEIKDRAKNAVLTNKQITEQINLGREYPYSDQRIGTVLDALGFKKTKTSIGGSAILLDDDHLNRLRDNYGL